ncbi:DUF4177 domain-containing protein [Oceanibium sediminis]|uniref:DUF4177 domain-containing protein n=1 Tax=Oceanibium sediminis TaxID=2026339 RepID=UPI000DD47B3A|nr:DUF4177 domain-containing protein [Oceanibium sediminis]
MQNFEYRIIPAPRRAKRAKGARTPSDRYARTLTDLVNAEAAEGWEYLRADTLPVDEKQGMLSSAKEVFQTVLVFRRERSASAPAKGASASVRPIRAEPGAPSPAMPLGPAARTED